MVWYLCPVLIMVLLRADGSLCSAGDASVGIYIFDLWLVVAARGTASLRGQPVFFTS